MSPRRARRTTVGGALAGLLLLAPLPAVADPSGTLPGADEVRRSRATVASTADAVGRIEARLAAAGVRADRLATDVAHAVEAYNGARVRLDAAERRARAAQDRARTARAAVEEARVSLGRFAAAAYRSGGDIGGLSAYLAAGGPRDLISRAAALQAIGTSRRHALDGFRSAQVEAGLLQTRADRLVTARHRAARRVAGAKDRAESRLAGQQQVLAEAGAVRTRLIRSLAVARDTTVRLERERQAGLDREREEAARRAARAQARAAARAAERAAARRAAEQRRADEQRTAEEQRRADELPAAGPTKQAPTPEPATPSAPAPATPAPSVPSVPAGSSTGSASGAERAIAFARAQIGKAYQWAADGPGSYDCSGLTLRAWEQGGVSLPHYSVAQYERSAKVAVADIRPGDLVFFASDSSNHRTIYHVGLYIGGGQMIEAPYTGESVRVSSIWRGSLFGAARP
jgi:cell wall-associated NlpC family hydrolase